MKPSDFTQYDIHNFSAAEIEDTGAKLKDVDRATIVYIQKYREYVRRPVKLVKNGITTGIHKAPEHKQGKAIDTYLNPADGLINVHLIFKGALVAGFRGIGIYWNGTCYSCHFDLRKNYAFWAGVKDIKKGIKNWQFHGLLSDPAKIKIS